uniref:Uncharacterized protein n=1 Tax=Ditylenchus dipsaci TaxID=166011 RepID=A0A915DZK8_9BILA
MAMDNVNDDEIVVEQVVRPAKKVELVELGSSSDEDEKKSILNNGQGPHRHQHYSPSTVASNVISRFQRNGSRIQRLTAKKNKKRPRRNSAEYDNNDLTADGIHLVNAGKPSSDPDVHFSPHFSRILQPHQIGGVKFLYDNIIESIESFNNSDGAGCILAHSMGLGKSIQVISFIEIFFRATRSTKVLIICPINVIQNWAMEFEKWLPEFDELGTKIRDFQVFLLGDSVKGLDNRAKFIEKWHADGGVLLIGYEMFRQLVRPMPRSKKTAKELDEAQILKNAEIRKGLVEALLVPGPHLVVCDEGHKIKNIKTEVAAALNAIHTRRRIVLTGYPLQNNLMEYYCMVDFVRPSLLGTKKEFCTMFEKPINKGLCIDSTPKDIKLARQRTHVLRGIIHGFIQRRTQHLLKKILPVSREYIMLVRKTPIQHELYRGFIGYASEEMRSQNSNWFNPLKAYSICSKVLNHPDLLFNALQKKKKIYQEALKNQKERRIESIRIQELAQQQQQQFNATVNQSHMQQQNPAQYYQSALQFTAATNYPSTSNGYVKSETHPASDWSLNSAQSTYYGNSSNIACACGERQQHPQSNACNNKSNNGAVRFGSNGGCLDVNLNSSQKGQKRCHKGVLEEEMEDEEELPEDNSIKFDWAEEILRNYISGALENSAKMVIAMEIINETMRRGEKILLFSVLTLDLFENYLKQYQKEGQEQWRKNVNYCRFDGSTNASDRERFINRFNHDPDLSLFLISTRAGSLGVNLVSANRCIIFDASWNPCHDAQAICRVYRYGQKKRTFIYRLIVNNSMEKGIFNRQISKMAFNPKNGHFGLERVVDAENIDANVTSKELESLLFYDESQDVICGKWDVDQWQLEDELLIHVAKQNSTLFAECPFLHEREKNGGFINDQPPPSMPGGGVVYGSSASRHPHNNLPPPYPSHTNNPYNPNPHQSMSISTPFPKNLELASNLSASNGQSRGNEIVPNPFIPSQNMGGANQHGTHNSYRSGNSGMLIISREVQLPSVIHAGKHFVLRPGEAVNVLRSAGGVYFRTQDGNLLDARSLVPPKCDPPEVIELD